MTYQVLDTVVLDRELPEHGLRKGDLAAAKAVGLVPKPQRALLKQQIGQAKTQPQLAQQC